MGLGLIIAGLFDRVRRESLAKTFVFLPLAISLVGASVIWGFVYAWQPAGQPQIGLLNAIVVGFGGQPIPWLTTSPINIFAEIVILIWLQTGFAMVVLSAAIKGVSTEIIEAARLDGANERQLFFRVIVPMIRGSIITVATTIAIVTLKIFDIVYVTTGGRFNDDVVANRMFHEIFQFFNDGRGAALATLLFLAVLPVMFINLRNFRRQAGGRMTAPAEPIEQPRRSHASPPGGRRSCGACRCAWRSSPSASCGRCRRSACSSPPSATRSTSRHPAGGRRCSTRSNANQWTLSNYQTVIASDGMGDAFINSLIVTIPATVIPITIAAFAAYAFAWIPFRGRGILFTIVVALLVVPIQMSLIPILQIYSGREPVRHVPRHLAGAHGLRPAAGDLPALQLHLAAAARPVRVRRHRRRVPLPGVHPDRAAAVDAGARSRSRSSSSCGSGTTCWWRSSSSGRVPTSASCRPPSTS